MADAYQKPTGAGTVTENPAIDIGVSDEELVSLIRRKVAEYDAIVERKGIDRRAKRNVAYWKGEQSRDGDPRGGPKTRYVNNVIHRDLATRVQNATSRMPDIVVMSPEQDEDPEVKLQAKAVEDWLSIRMDSDVTRRLAQGAVRDNHLKYRGIWKYRYDERRRDAVIERLRPEDVVLDATARIPEDGYTCDGMEFIGEWIEMPTADVLEMFPSKKEELLAAIGKDRQGGKPASSKVRFLQSCARVSGDRIVLVNSYNDLILSKGPHPYWDERRPNEQVLGIIPADKLHPEIAAQLPALGLEVPEKEPPKPRKFNHFPFPRMPYSVFSGENAGDGPFDDVSVVEVALPMQDVVNLRGDQISAINDWAVGKTAVSTTAMTAEKASNISRDPSEILTVKLSEGQSVGDVIQTFTGEPASPALYQDLQQAIQAIDSHFSTNPVTRGETVTAESGVSKQISREGDLSASDDIAQTQVQRCVEEAANWLVQLGKIYFDDPRRATAPGPDSTTRSASIARDTIPDDIQVVVKANAVDKMTIRNMSVNLVASKAIDPMSLFQDLGYPNPKERTQLLVDFLNGAPYGFAKYLKDIGADPGKPAGEQSELESSATPQGPAGAPAQPVAPAPPSAPAVPAQPSLPAQPGQPSA